MPSEPLAVPNEKDRQRVLVRGRLLDHRLDVRASHLKTRPGIQRANLCRLGPHEAGGRDIAAKEIFDIMHTRDCCSGQVFHRADSDVLAVH